MFRNFLNVTAVALLAAASLCAQRATVVSVDADAKIIVVKLDGAEHKVDGSTVKLLDADGKPVQCTDFTAGETVTVTREEQQITQVQKVRKARPLAAQGPQAGTIVSVDVDNDRIVVKFDGIDREVTASKIKLLDKDGREATLKDFQPNDAVEVTVVEGAVTQLKKS